MGNPEPTASEPGVQPQYDWPTRAKQPSTPALGERENPALLPPLSRCSGSRRLPEPLAGIVNSLKPARFENKHVRFPRRTILGVRPETFHRRELPRFPPLLAKGGGTMHIH